MTEFTGSDYLLFPAGYHWAGETVTWSILPSLEGTYAPAIQAALNQYDRIAEIDFVRLPENQFDSADLKFIELGSNRGGAEAYTWLVTGQGSALDMVVIELPVSGIVGGRTSYVITHEIGHALGLKHPLPLDGTPSSVAPHAPSDAVIQTNTVMGYYSFHNGTLGKWDIQSMNALYGPETDTPWNDTIFGGDSSNFIVTGPGYDTVYANKGNDVIYTGSENDTVFGGQGDDVVYAGNGFDLLYGDVGDDVLYGDGSNDTIHGGSGDNLLYGGAGYDLFVIANNSNNTIGDFDTEDDVLQFASAAVHQSLGDDGLTIYGNSWSVHLPTVDFYLL